MRLPNGHRAVVDPAKLADYCLNLDHEDGKHKARLFAAALGLSRSDCGWLRERLLDAAVQQPAVITAETEFGVLYVVDFPVAHSSHSAMVRSAWIVRRNEDFPRLTTCFVLVGKKP